MKRLVIAWQMVCKGKSSEFSVSGLLPYPATPQCYELIQHVLETQRKVGVRSAWGRAIPLVPEKKKNGSFPLNFFLIFLGVASPPPTSPAVTGFEKNIFSVLAKRILDEANRRIERKKRIKFIVTKKSGNSIYDTNILINKCFNILRVLGEKKEFVINNIQTIENSLSPLIEFFKDLQSIDFDEDIVLIMTSIIHNYEKIPNIGFSLFDN